MASEYVRWRPAEPVRRFAGWYSGYRESGGAPGTHRGLPSPHLTLIITLDDPLTVACHPDPATPPGRYDALVGGLHTVPALITHPGRQSGIQVGLSPLGARALLGLPAGELAGLDVHAVDLLGPFAEELRERVLAAPTWAARFAVVDRELARRAADVAGPPPEVVRAWQLVRGTAGAVSVEDLADEVGWSSRHLRERFVTEIGLTPKAAGRVARFDRARRVLQRRGAGDLARLAVDCGYYDQAHLTRDFTAFAGCSPLRWLATDSPPASPEDPALP